MLQSPYLETIVNKTKQNATPSQKFDWNISAFK